jgi:transcriptional regulator with XRE-family HTH domain
MLSVSQSKTLTQAIGERIRDLREATGLRQEDVASSARGRFGLLWTQATVAAIETGKRQLTVEELILLPLLLTCELGELLPKVDPHAKDEWIALTPQTDVRARVIRNVLNGMARDSSPLDIESAVDQRRRKSIPTFLTNDQELRLRQLRNEAASDAAIKAAQRLRITPLEIAEVARGLWRRSITEERDARIAERIQGEEPRTVQALRGHVTRALLDELRAILKSKRKPKKGKRS